MLKTVWNVPNSDRFQNCIICWKNTEILLKFLLIFCSALSEICLECSNFSQISDIEFRKISDNIQNKISKKFIYVSAKNLHEDSPTIRRKIIYTNYRCSVKIIWRVPDSCVVAAARRGWRPGRVPDNCVVWNCYRPTRSSPVYPYPLLHFFLILEGPPIWILKKKRKDN